MSLILAITSLGNWFAVNLTRRNNSSSFIEFVWKLREWIQNEAKLEPNKIVIILDNWSIHKSKKSIEALLTLGWKIIFLVPYSPEWAPVELLFNTLKRRLQKHTRNQLINLSKSEGFNIVKEWLATFSQKEIISYWKKAIESITSLFSI